MSQTVRQFEVSNLNVEMFDEAAARYRPIVSEVSFVLRAGQGLGITGESGSGKTTLSLALSGLLPAGSRISAKRFELDFVRQAGGGLDRGRLTEAGRLDLELCALRGRHICTLFQEPRASLNPYRTIGWQLARCRRQGRRNLRYQSFADQRSPSDGGATKASSICNPQSAIHNSSPNSSAITALSAVGLDPDVLRHYPHELSTGMCQRVFLAMASLLGSSILIADEPFASVDPETQDLLAQLVQGWMQTKGLILILVSHDLELLRRLTDQTMVLYQGQVAESGTTDAVLARGKPIHPYTWLLREVDDRTSLGSRFLAGGGGSTRGVRCQFAARCAWADPTLCTEPLPLFRADSAADVRPGDAVDGSHRVRCVRHPIAGVISPSIDMPPVGDPPLDPETPGLKIEGMGRGPESLESLNLEDWAASSPPGDQVLRVSGLAKQFRTGWIRRRVKVVFDEVEFCLREGERLGIMGPSGQGKTTLARLILGLLKPSAGGVELAVANHWITVGHWKTLDRMRFRRRVQMLYQDADLVLDPALRVGDTLVEAYRVFDSGVTRWQAYRWAARLLVALALPCSMLEAYPYRLSGGERKRVALARTLAALGCPFQARSHDPWRLLVLDEPTSGVDVVLQAVLSRFLLWAQPRLRLCYLVISHDEAFVRRFCHRAFRLENGRVSPCSNLLEADKANLTGEPLV